MHTHTNTCTDYQLIKTIFFPEDSFFLLYDPGNPVLSPYFRYSFFDVFLILFPQDFNI